MRIKILRYYAVTGGFLLVLSSCRPHEASNSSQTLGSLPKDEGALSLAAYQAEIKAMDESPLVYRLVQAEPLSASSLERPQSLGLVEELEKGNYLTFRMTDYGFEVDKKYFKDQLMVLDDRSRPNHAVEVRNGKLYVGGVLQKADDLSWDFSSTDTSAVSNGRPPIEDWKALAYVMDGKGQIFAGPDGGDIEDRPGQKVYKHSSYLGGAPVAAAGQIYVDTEGSVRLINNRSGHYQPPPLATEQFIHRLRAQGAQLDDVLVGDIDRATSTKEKYKRAESLAGRVLDESTGREILKNRLVNNAATAAPRAERIRADATVFHFDDVKSPIEQVAVLGGGDILETRYRDGVVATTLNEQTSVRHTKQPSRAVLSENGSASLSLNDPTSSTTSSLTASSRSFRPTGQLASQSADILSSQGQRSITSSTTGESAGGLPSDRLEKADIKSVQTPTRAPIGPLETGRTTTPIRGGGSGKCSAKKGWSILACFGGGL